MLYEYGNKGRRVCPKYGVRPGLTMTFNKVLIRLKADHALVMYELSSHSTYCLFLF